MAEAALDPSFTSPPTTPQLSLRQRALRGSLWTLGGYGFQQFIRLGSSLILTRLLFPEAFGLMSLVQVFLQGLEMFSDLGIQPSIIHNKRGQDPDFLNTAWTVQVLRGMLLWLGACLLAWPAAQLYGEPMLLTLLPVVGLSTVFSGFRSTKLVTANRQLLLGRLTLLEIGCHLISIVTVILFAWKFQSVWALVVGSLLGAALEMITSHLLLEGERNRFQWDRAAARELWSFGRWIFLSTLLAYFATQGDRLVMGGVLDVRYLGIYGIAVTISRAVVQAVAQVATRVLFPSYAELVRERPEHLYGSLRKSRIVMLALIWSSALLLLVCGEPLIAWLYDDRYREAGWMLRLITLGTFVHAIGQSYTGVLLSRGMSKPLAVILGYSALVQFAAMLLGAHWGGRYGLVLGIAVTSWFVYPLEAYYYRRISLWQPEVDLPLYFAATGIAALVLFF